MLSEKKRIAEIEKFVKKTEVLDTIINEPEEIKKEEKEKKKEALKQVVKNIKTLILNQKFLKLFMKILSKTHVLAAGKSWMLFQKRQDIKFDMFLQNLRL